MLENQNNNFNFYIYLDEVDKQSDGSYSGFQYVVKNLHDGHASGFVPFLEECYGEGISFISEFQTEFLRKSDLIDLFSTMREVRIEEARKIANKSTVAEEATEEGVTICI